MRDHAIAASPRPVNARALVARIAGNIEFDFCVCSGEETMLFGCEPFFAGMAMCCAALSRLVVLITLVIPRGRPALHQQKSEGDV